MLRLAICAAVFAVACAHNSAIVYLFDPTGKSGVTGNINFTRTEQGILVDGEIRGLKQGHHGFHIHQLGNIGTGCLATGGHFNPHKQNHGGPEDKVRHVGDLGNIEAGSDGVAHIKFVDNLIQLQGENCIIGRGVVVHENEDDLGKGGQSDSLTTGHAGGRLACGVIGLLD